MSNRDEIVINAKQLKKVLTRETYHNRAVDFIRCFDRYKTPQGPSYWERRYYRLYELDLQIEHSLEKEEMSEEDWEYLGKLITPDDPFLEDKGNKEYVT